MRESRSNELAPVEISVETLKKKIYADRGAESNISYRFG